MKSRQILSNPKTFVVVFASGEEASQGLAEFARSHQIMAASLTAIGALERCTLGYFSWERKEYQKIQIDEQVEVLAMIGNFADKEGKPQLHAHLVVGKADGSAHGGHLLEALVRPTLEVTIVEAPVHLRRKFDAASKLALIDPAAGG